MPLSLEFHKQPMSFYNKNTIAGDSTLRGQSKEDQSTKSTDAQDQTLLQALQNLIVRVMDPEQSADTNQIHLGPEAGKLITALQDFISSIVVRSQYGTQNTIVEVSLDEEENDLQRQVVERVDEYGIGDSPTLNWSTLSPISPTASNFSYINSRNLLALEKPQSTFEETLMRALREHIFNKMPIRLLCFDRVGSSLCISLLEKSAIYKHLASAMEGNTEKRQFYERMETDEEAIERLITKHTSYAILSHTWLRTAAGEVTYNDWHKGLFSSEDPGYQKLVNFCKTAWKDHELTLGWMDTVCIDKESSSELDESIRSMYRWYEDAAVCITYLAETETFANMHLDPWFTRGWTLQELLAPKITKFYNGHWQRLVDRYNNDKEVTMIVVQIKRATTISEQELKNIHSAPMSRRMQLAATREVTRAEDTAYSLMGIFNVSFSTAYGEGAERAFLRLLQQIITSTKYALEILNWAGDVPFSSPYTSSAILPTSPQCYIKRASNRSLKLPRPMEPLTLSHLGLYVPFILMPGISIRSTELRGDSIGDYNATVDISLRSIHRHSIPTTYNLLDNRISGEDGWKDNRLRYQMTFGVFNFTSAGNTTFLPTTCIALALQCDQPAGEVSKLGRRYIVRTNVPIVFKLSNTNSNNLGSDDSYSNIQTSELPKHGMQLISLYL